jgi:hypothetical protein
MEALGKGKLKTNLNYCEEARPLSRRAPARTPEADGRGPEGAEGAPGPQSARGQAHHYGGTSRPAFRSAPTRGSAYIVRSSKIKKKQRSSHVPSKKGGSPKKKYIDLYE